MNKKNNKNNKNNIIKNEHDLLNRAGRGNIAPHWCWVSIYSMTKMHNRCVSVETRTSVSECVCVCVCVCPVDVERAYASGTETRATVASGAETRTSVSECVHKNLILIRYPKHPKSLKKVIIIDYFIFSLY